MLWQPSIVEQGVRCFDRVKILNTAAGQMRVEEVEDTKMHTYGKGARATSGHIWKIKKLVEGQRTPAIRKSPYSEDSSRHPMGLLTEGEKISPPVTV